MIIRFLKAIVISFIHPVKCLAPMTPWRRFLTSPWVFQPMSIIVQFFAMPDLRKLREERLSDTSHLTGVHDHNTGKIFQKPFSSTRRFEPLLRHLTLPIRDIGDEKLLMIGCKNVHEMLMANVYGYRWDNISGIDIFSAHKKIQSMNAEEMTFPDASFDCVVMSGVMGYLKSPDKVFAGVERILKPGGLFVFDVMHRRKPARWETPPLEPREVLALFEPLPMNVYSCVRDSVHYANEEQPKYIIGMQKLGRGFETPDILLSERSVERAKN